jgi:hypothetical protein
MKTSGLIERLVLMPNKGQMKRIGHAGGEKWLLRILAQRPARETVNWFVSRERYKTSRLINVNEEKIMVSLLVMRCNPTCRAICTA